MKHQPPALPSKSNKSEKNARQVIKVLFPCKCGNKTGKSNNLPRSKPLITYQTAGDTLWIPLPCSCDKVDDNSVLHYAYVVESGNTTDIIAQKYGTTPQTLLSVNGIDDPKTLQAGQVLDVPRPVCKSNVGNNSMDFPLLVPNGTYFYTANSSLANSAKFIEQYREQYNSQSIESESHFLPSRVQNHFEQQMYVNQTFDEWKRVVKKPSTYTLTPGQLLLSWFQLSCLQSSIRNTCLPCLKTWHHFGVIQRGRFNRRIPVQTYTIKGNDKGFEEAYKMMMDELKDGGKVYLVYPVIELSEQLPQLRAASADLKSISDQFPGYNCGLLHGRMRNEEESTI
ncbi:hypothetical protein KIW84_015807 [Lathyrus oleraceus]|uniref:LysM domain-containing protein n=1 Tax=Pisum sativum TaxID=3888 RepID=A0A9D5H176_PEA|nr:hypothetical protein KIW84_015807 [Pisum sativum]